MEFTGHRIEIVLCIVYCYQARPGPVVVVVVCHNLHRSLFTCWCCVGIFGHTTIVYYAFDLVLLSSKVACFLSNKYIVKSLEIKKRSEMISLVNTDTMIENEPYSNGKCQVVPYGQIIQTIVHILHISIEAQLVEVQPRFQTLVTPCIMPDFTNIVHPQLNTSIKHINYEYCASFLFWHQNYI